MLKNVIYNNIHYNDDYDFNYLKMLIVFIQFKNRYCRYNNLTYNT